jgi:hypothetical protein
MTIITVATAVTLCITVADKNHIALYVIKKDITYKNILRRSKKSLRLNLKISLKTASKSE